MTITPHPHQQRAASEITERLQAHRLAYLTGEVRTGKTIAALEVVRRMALTSVLIVTKKKAIKSIEKDRDGMGLSDVVTVTNYEQLPKFRGKSYAMVIVDEAHCVGAYPKPPKRLLDIRSLHYSMVLLMSGTPSPESFSQLYHQYAVGGGPWSAHRNFYAWARAGYVDVREKRVGTGQTVNDYTRANEGRIMGDIAPYVVRITQREAGITTEIQEQVHVVPMSDRTRRLMRRIAKDGVVGRLGLRQVLADTGASRMVKLRQLAGGTVKWERQRVGGDGVLTAPEGGSTCFDRSKVDYIRRTFTGKTAILYTFIAEGDMLREAYGDRASDSPEEFNADPSKVFIGQVQSSREGVNLSSADDIVFYGIDYAALSYLQARDRASYIGRTRANRVHWVFAQGSLEPMVFRVVKNKESYTVKHYNRDAGKLGATQDHQADGEGGLDGHQDHPGEHGGASRPVAAARWGGPVGGGQTAGEEAHRLAIRAARAVAADGIQC